MDSVPKKGVQEDAKSVIVELEQQRSRKEHLLHAEYNTEHEVSAILDELRAAVRGEGGQQEVQPSQIVHLLLAEAMGRKYGIVAIPVKTTTQPPPSTHGRRIEADPQHAATKPRSGNHRTVVSIAGKRLHPMRGKPVQGDEEGRNDAEEKEGEEVRP